ncbi:MAG TPA: hypothetical protein P5044_02570 [bacterium]|nr:hypothetical protein [bacterium]
MRNILIILLLFLFWSCTSCNGNNPKNDSDSLADNDTKNDIDSVRTDKDIDDLSDDPSDEVLTESDDEWERDVEIPDMSGNPYWEEYSDSDKNIAYYYYGDKPVKSSDPEDVKALWSKVCGGDMCEECTPAPYDQCSENYAFESIMVNGTGDYFSKKASEAGKFQCDALLTAGWWYASDIANTVLFNEVDGKILSAMQNGTTSWQGGGAYAYDINTRKVERIGRGYMDGWQNRKYYFVSTYDQRIDSDYPDSPYYGPKNRHLLYYDKELNKYGYALKFAETPSELVDVRASETYLFMSAYFGGDATDMRLLYTKIGEWNKWKELTYKKDTLYGSERRAGYPSMIDSFVVYFDYDIQVQFCDLSKGDAGCFKVSREDEYGRYPLLKDKNTVIYSSQETTGDKKVRLVMADITNKSDIKYTVLYEWSELNSIQAGDFDEKHILFMRKYSNGGTTDVKDTCLYRFKDGKVVCMEEPFDLKIIKDSGYLYNHVYVFQSKEELVVRDLECYCDFYPAKCPLSDYTPNTEKPKKPWGFDWKPGS